MESKRRGGWWTLVTVMLAPFALYVAAYYYEAEQFEPVIIGFSPGIRVLYRDERPGDDTLDRIFWPIHQLDRMIRPSVWADPVNPLRR